MSIKEQIRAEIERQKTEELNRNSIGVITGSAFFVKADDLLSFLDTLPEQPVEGMEEDLKQEYDSYCHKHLIGEYLPSRRKMLDFARHFAEWGAEHLKK